jgi:hypothetical protein
LAVPSFSYPLLLDVIGAVENLVICEQFVNVLGSQYVAAFRPDSQEGLMMVP